MQKQKGFTLIELLVVMGIIGILAVIGAPSFLLMQNRVNFKDDAQQFLDLLGEVRSNALSNKKCVDNSGASHDSLKWSAYIDRTAPGASVYCQWDSGMALQADQSNYTLKKVTDIDYVGSEGNTDYSNFVLISYLSGTGQTKIETFPTLADLQSNTHGTVQDDIRVTFTWPEGNNGAGDFISICIDGVGGFTRKGGETCPAK